MKELKIDHVDRGILESLLEDHIRSGVYWGVKEHHYKRCKKLLEKLSPTTPQKEETE